MQVESRGLNEPGDRWSDEPHASEAVKKSIRMLESEKWGLTSNFRRAQIVEMYE
jgi:hypothetical protein